MKHIIGRERPGKRGRGADGKILVLVAVEDKENYLGRIKLCKILDASSESITPAVKKSVEPGSKIRKDGWRGYSKIKNDYNHIVICKITSVENNLLPLSNRVTSSLKAWLQGTHQGAVQASHLEYYL